MSGLRPYATGLRRHAALERDSFFRRIPNFCARLRQLLELVTAGEQVIGQGNSLEHAAKVAMREFASGRPIPAATYDRGKLRSDCFPAQIQAAQQRRRS